MQSDQVRKRMCHPNMLIGPDLCSCGRDSSTDLSAMQDLVGVRAIMPDFSAVQEVAKSYRSVVEGGTVQRETDYIQSPKDGGYRSLHLIIKFVEQGQGQEFKGSKVEIQLRTRLQHAWATTVEAVGSMRNEDLKASEGDPDWLRFMNLMAAHMAELEGLPIGDAVPQNSKERVS